MSISILYFVVFAVAVICGFAGINKPNSKLNIVACLVMIAGCIYAAYKYSWFHILGLVGITLIGINIFTAINLYKQRKESEKARIDELFKVDDDDEE
ncbi:MAG: hypothetical protein Q4C80_03200 [Bacillota bacterium]|nr:hypothetical protein [Bacillota bacterium]